MNTQLDTNESWEQRETQIKLERAEEFAKMSPADQVKVLEEEKVKFTKEKEEARKSLGFQKFDPKASAEAKKQTSKDEQTSKDSELAKFEQSLDKKSPQAQPEASEKDSQVDQKRFNELYQAAIRNIESQKPFEFQSMAADDHGRLANHFARMTRITDHSQKSDLSPAEVSDRLLKKQTKPEQIGLTIDIDMGEDQNNHLGLMNLRLELPLASLQEGHFSEKIAKFTNIVLFAATLHDKQQKVSNSKPAEIDQKKSFSQDLEKIKEKSGLKTLRSEGGLNNNPSLEQGDLSTVTFSCNNGAIWGTFDQHGISSNPKELQEALDKIIIEK
ncbi:hypothetical protein IT412_02605 [Candidatus Peregrinibacteria bacterium]|nr:hypothetical protein [Candidatus Peregrinibacteria bacterium]